MTTLEETVALISRLPEQDQRRVRDLARQLLSQRPDPLPGRKSRWLTVRETVQDDAIDTLYAELRIG